VPGDKSIGHRALLFASLAEGESTVRGLSGGLDNLATARAMAAMGVGVEVDADTARVSGVGLRGLSMPGSDLDCGNSGTTMRLLAGLLVAQPFGCRLVGDASLSRRPMHRIVEPLRARGGHIAGTAHAGGDDVYPPLAVAPLVEAETLRGLEYAMPVASAQVKSALLLSGLYANGPTALREPTLSRDHTERMMVALGLPIETIGPMVVLDPTDWSGSWAGFEWTVPGDLSSAAFLVAAAHIVPDSEVVVEGVGLNPTRTGLLDALRPMRGGVDVEHKGDAGGGEPVGDLHTSHHALGPGLVGGELLTRMIDDVPAFCSLASAAGGTTVVRDARELRVKESDRISATTAVLEAFGVPCEELPDGLRIGRAERIRPARVPSRGDHRIAMAATVLALGADGESVVEDVGCVDTSFPGFDTVLRALGADVVRVEAAS
jgi:3-phosphoshikimate 1-carboxyvinyltransferase